MPPTQTGIRVCSRRILTQTAPLNLQASWVVCLYNKKTCFHEIIKECNKVYKLMLTHSSKRSRTQVNAFEDNSKDEEQERNDQALINLSDGDTARQQKDKCTKTDQEPALAAANTAIRCLC